MLDGFGSFADKKRGIISGFTARRYAFIQTGYKPPEFPNLKGSCVVGMFHNSN